MYKAIVTTIKTRPHPNADRIQLGIACGYQVIIGLEVKNGNLGVYFPCDGQLSHEMCMKNSLYNKNPETGESMGGYFDKNRRVRAQIFRGEKSEGFWIPVSFFEWTGVTLKEGMEFDSLNGINICNKYFPPATQNAIANNKIKKTKSVRYSTNMFYQHFDTAQLRFNLNLIPKGALIILSEKLHGTSGRTGYVLTEKNIKPWQYKINKLFRKYIFKPKPIWMKLTGSRRVTFFPDQSKDFYYKTNFRETISNDLSLRKGETLYYEIVGFTDSGSSIMETHTVHDKNLIKRYGKDMTYSYGVPLGAVKPWRIFVYRITQTNEEGHSVDLSHSQMLSRVKELGLESVPVLDTFIHDGNPENLLEQVKKYADGPSTLDQSHIREGVAIRVEHENMHKIFKYKGFHFCELEGIRKNDDTYVDLEDIS